MFDNILLLGVGGKTVFEGSPDSALNYFAEKGFPCPEYQNPADWFMDLTSGKILLADGEENNYPPVPDFSLLWEEASHKQESATLNNAQPLGPTRKQENAPFLHQFFWFLYRAFLQQVRDIKSVFLDVFIQCLPGFGMGIVALTVGKNKKKKKFLHFFAHSHTQVETEAYYPPLTGELISTCPYIIRQLCETAPLKGDFMIVVSFFITMTAGAASGFIFVYPSSLSSIAQLRKSRDFSCCGKSHFWRRKDQFSKRKQDRHQCTRVLPRKEPPRYLQHAAKYCGVPELVSSHE
jgi:hypothetical protein